MKLSANFALAEFMTPLVPEDYPAEWQTTRLMELVRVVQWGRDCAGTPGIVTSAYRSPAHNAEVGGVSDSQHMEGEGADVVFALTPLRTLAASVLRSIADGTAPQFGQVIVYKDKGHVHLSSYAARLGTKNGQVLYSSGVVNGVRQYSVLAAVADAERVPVLSDPQTRGVLWLGVACIGLAALCTRHGRRFAHHVARLAQITR